MIILKENYDEWLQYVDPSLNALISYLSRQNDGIPVKEQTNLMDKNGRKIHVMTNGLSYSKNENGRWTVVLL